MDHDTTKPDFARNGVNLASSGLGAKAVHATDDFFAPVERMLDDSAPVFIPDKYDDHGKWMDGWESRRRRDLGHDHATVRLACAGRILGVDIDTAHFTGNYPPAASLEACRIDGDPDEKTEWTQILPAQPLKASSRHFFACENTGAFTHIRLHLYPDGGVARLRIYGQPEFDAGRTAGNKPVDLASALLGGRCVAYSDAHYGEVWRLLAPGRGKDMGDGWETRRRREPGNDWIIVRLGARGTIEKAVIDTAHFKGNFPDSCSIQAADLGDLGDGLDDMVITSSMFWKEILPQKKLSADAIHEFGGDDVRNAGPVTHVRLNIHPDGGVSRLRLFGKPAT